MRLASAFLLCCCLLTSFVHAQTSRLIGTVTAVSTGEPLPGVNVYLEGTTQGAASDAEGRFQIEDVQPGTYTLIARYLGFAAIEHDVAIQGTETTVALRLSEDLLEIPEVVVERVTLTGGRYGAHRVAGSAHYLDPKTLSAFSYADVNRVLQAVPGVYIQEEDGYGLRPNIGMRGTGAERSSKITLMEDGVLMAPAPYAAPAAYYFPTMGRMQGLEVRKGSSQVKYGPYTTGGALNLISTQIPELFSGQVDVLGGSHDERTVHAHLGSSFENVGFLVETLQGRSDGFKQLDGGGTTGFDKRDYLAKLRFNTSPGARIAQTLTLKLGRATESSDETYLGLTQGDFEANPVRRYAGSQQDVMDTEQTQYVARHVIRPTERLDVTTTAYATEFARNWYKLDRVRASTDGSRVKIASILASPTTYADEYAILAGTTSENGNALEVKANNRSYYARGVQSVLGVNLGSDTAPQALEIGVRLHRDQIDRFQWVDAYRMTDGAMTLTNAGTPGTESNRVETATAIAGYAQYEATLGRLTFTPGLRYEHVTIARDDYGSTDPTRTGANLAMRENTVDAWMPGLSVAYQWTPAVQTFAGVHRGFAPPGSKAGTQPEQSINYEVGGRYVRGDAQAEATFFFNDYSNLLGADLAAAGGEGSNDQFNGGAVDVQGLELSGQYNLSTLANTAAALPVRVSYTYTQATFQTAFESDFEGWGTVAIGDELPYLPEHQLNVRFGVETRRFAAYANGSYVSAMRTQAGQGDFVPSQSTDARFVLDLSADVQVTRYAAIFASIRNLTDATYIVARRPAGLRPGLPRTLSLGVKTQF
ncbi:MAG: TonB-dependent receptor [Rhodothermales bacterium]